MASTTAASDSQHFVRQVLLMYQSPAASCVPTHILRHMREVGKAADTGGDLHNSTKSTWRLPRIVLKKGGGKLLYHTHLVREHGLVDLERRLGAVGLDAPNVVRPAPRQRRAQGVHLETKTTTETGNVNYLVQHLGGSRAGDVRWKYSSYIYGVRGVVSIPCRARPT